MKRPAPLNAARARRRYSRPSAAKSSFADLVQYNDGFRSNLIGTPQQIAQRILALKGAGADLILLGFLHFQEEVEYFGKQVIPLVRALEARQKIAVAAE